MIRVEARKGICGKCKSFKTKDVIFVEIIVGSSEIDPISFNLCPFHLTQVIGKALKELAAEKPAEEPFADDIPF